MKTVILGAGPSGLGTAWSLVDAGFTDIVIIEKNATVGGLSGSFSIGDHIVDFGPHRLSPEYPDIVKKIGRLLGKDLLEVPNDHAVVYHDRVYRYPPRPIDFLNFDSILTGVRVVFGWLKERARRRQLGPVATFEEIVVHNFGRPFYEEIVLPLCHKIWGDPATLDPEFARVRFSLPTVGQWIQKLLDRNKKFNDKVFYYPRLGFQQIWDRMAEHLKSKGVEILTESQAKTIHVDGHSYATGIQVQTPTGTQEIALDWLVSTIPTQHFARLLQPNPFATEALMSHSFVNLGVVFVTLEIDKPRCLPARVIIFPESKHRFSRVYEQNQFSRDTVANNRSLIMADVITKIDSDIWNQEDSLLTEEALTQLVSCKLVDPDQVLDSKVIRIPIAYPQPTTKREESQSHFNQTLGKYKNIICTGRFASSDYNNSHTALKKSELAARTIIENKEISYWYHESESIRKLAIRD